MSTADCPTTSVWSFSATRCWGWGSPTACMPPTRTWPRGSWPSCAPQLSTCARWPRRPARGAWGGTAARARPSTRADTMEAVLPAVYLSGGFPAATTFVHRLLDPLMESSASLEAGLGSETSLQELTASGSLGVPESRVAEHGPDHKNSFHAEVRVGSELMGSGSGSSKKEAEQMAAEVAWTELNRRAQAVLSSAVEPVHADTGDFGHDGAQHLASGEADRVDVQDA